MNQTCDFYDRHSTLHVDIDIDKSKRGWQTDRSLVSAAQNLGGRCMLQDCQNFSCGRAYSFVIGYDVLIRFHGQARVHTLEPN